MGASALVLLFTAFWSLKSVHAFLAHHHASTGHPVCEAAHDPDRAHIHDERWAHENCSLCAFVVSASEPFSISALPVFPSKPPDSEQPRAYRAPVVATAAMDSAMRRGPPGQALA